MRPPRRLNTGDRVELVGHLEELRTRVLICGIALVITSVAAFIRHGQLIELLNAPLPLSVGRPTTFGVAEPFTTSVKISLMAGMLGAMPIVLWQVWAFFVPAFDAKRVRTLAWFAVAALFAMAAGVTFGYLVALPSAIRFLTAFDSDLYQVQLRAASYYSFAVMALVSTAVVFELPVFIVGLVRLGIVRAATLRSSRRLGYGITAVIAVLLPGVDPVTTGITMSVLLVLFESSIWLARLVEPRERRNADAAVSPI